jgi:hypothetical protein
VASKHNRAAKAACCSQERIQYLLLGAASRRFRGADVANRPLIFLDKLPSALAGNGNVFTAAMAGAFIAATARNRACDFVGIDAAIGRGLCKFP